jgi:uncharacterized membrane protein YraQ (UPF0718 family)
MNLFVEAVVVAVAVAVVVEEVMVVVEAVMEDEEVMEEVDMEEAVTVMEDADTVADTVADIMEEVMEEVGVAGEVGVVGPFMAGLIAEANPVLIIFSKSLNDHPFSQ